MDSQLGTSVAHEQAANAAVAWLNEMQGAAFELTGIIDESAPATAEDAYELGLVLCDGEICARQQVRIQPSGSGITFTLVADVAPEIPPLLDPPERVRAQWIDGVLAKHEFVVLLFYRGLW